MSTADFEASLGFVLKWEGSKFTNDPDDHGGATRFGIIQREYDNYRRRRGFLARSVEFITMEEVREIYRRDYWESVQGDRLPAPLDIITFDTGVLMGVGRAIRFLQQSLKVGVDGRIGPETLGALAGADVSAVAADFLVLREARLHAIVERDSTQRKFLKGWLNRLNDLRRTMESHEPLNFKILSPEEDATTGRALVGSPDDFNDRASEGQTPKPYMMETMEAATFLEVAAPLRKLAENSLYTLDTSYPNRDVLRVATDTIGSGWFEIPIAVVESVTPLSFSGGNPTKVIASVALRPEFQSLASSFQRLSGSLNRSAAGSDVPLEESYGPTFVKAAYDLVGQDITRFDVARADDDPANPTPSDLTGAMTQDLVSAIALANYGTDQEASAHIVVEDDIREAARFLTSRTLPINIGAVRAFLDSCMNSVPHVQYGLGAKIHPHGAVPGRGFTRVDCSGFVREAIWRATSPHFNFPDGSVVQRDWIVAQGFQRSTPDAALLQDGVLRIAFLRPQEAPSPRHIGHVALVYNARTLESHGGMGPNSRAWTKTGWQAKAFVYVLNN